jgi:hypothetical protein
MSRTDGNGLEFNPPQAEIVNKSNQTVTIYGTGWKDGKESEKAMKADIKPGERYYQIEMENSETGKIHKFGGITDGKNPRFVEIYDVDAIIINDGQKYKDEDNNIRTNKNTEYIAGGHIKIGGVGIGSDYLNWLIPTSMTMNWSTIEVNNETTKDADNVLTVTTSGGVQKIDTPIITFGEKK